MAKRQRDWARRCREKLIEILGAKCADCGTTSALEFDCIIPQGNGHHEPMDPSWRMSFYRKQHATGNLQLLCRTCNAVKGDNFL